jgi:hypothetical protein
MRQKNMDREVINKIKKIWKKVRQEKQTRNFFTAMIETTRTIEREQM